MNSHLPPLDDAILIALSRLVDDAQSDTREPSHSDLEFCILQSGLTAGDPKAKGQPVGKAKRVRAVLSWSLENDYENGRKLVDHLLKMIRGLGGFRPESPNYVGAEAIGNLRDAMAPEGFVLAPNGMVAAQVLDSLAGAELTRALEAYVRRAQKGAEDAALLAGTAKDLVEATAAHVLHELYGNDRLPHNFPTLLGQAFVALDLKTPEDKRVDGEPPQHRLHRGLYEAACAINTMRNKQGTGHGRPWLPSVSTDESRHAVQVMGCVAEMLLRRLKERMRTT